MKKLIIPIALLMLIVMLGLWWGRNPPDEEDIESFMEKHGGEIHIINGYLLGLGDSDAIINNHTGAIVVDFEHRTVEDEAVREAIRVLWRGGCTSVFKCGDYNAIEYTIWKKTIGQVSCGFVYAIDEGSAPKVQFQTKLIPLPEDGWYYFLSEYEKWRVEQNS